MKMFYVFLLKGEIFHQKISQVHFHISNFHKLVCVFKRRSSLGSTGTEYKIYVKNVVMF